MQAINDIRRRYEVEKQEIINLEKEKVHHFLESIKVILTYTYVLNCIFRWKKLLEKWKGTMRENLENARKKRTRTCCEFRESMMLWYKMETHAILFI